MGLISKSDWFTKHTIFPAKVVVCNCLTPTFLFSLGDGCDWLGSVVWLWMKDYIDDDWLILSCAPPVSFSMCNEFSQIFQLCQFVMVCHITGLLSLSSMVCSTATGTPNQSLCLIVHLRKTPRMHLWSMPLWRPCFAFSTGFLWDTSLKPNWSALWCIRCEYFILWLPALLTRSTQLIRFRVFIVSRQD